MNIWLSAYLRNVKAVCVAVLIICGIIVGTACTIATGEWLVAQVAAHPVVGAVLIVLVIAAIVTVIEIPTCG